VKEARFPNLLLLILWQVEQIQWYCTSKKAVTKDAISDTWMKKIKRCDLLCSNLWNHATINPLELSFEAHLYNAAE
jgi:hypothetical protein